MAIREVRLLGDPILRTKAVPIDEVTDEIRSLIDDMFDTMYSQEGVGLAGPQIGVGQRIIVVDPHEEDVEPFALINPVIIETSTDVARAEEGCLSMPGLNEVIERAVSVVVEGLDRNGDAVRIDASGMLARVLQHEIDHIEGILFIDRVSPLKRKMLLSRWQKVKPEVAPG